MNLKKQNKQDCKGKMDDIGWGFTEEKYRISKYFLVRDYVTWEFAKERYKATEDFLEHLARVDPEHCDAKKRIVLNIWDNMY